MSFVGHTRTGSNYKNLFAEPPTDDSVDNRGRNVIARGLCRLKQWPGLATRYEKLVTVYRVGAVLNEVIARTRRLAGTLRSSQGYTCARPAAAAAYPRIRRSAMSCNVPSVIAPTAR